MIKINNRRYIGNKTKLLEEIYNCIQSYNFPQGSVFADPFAGTGVVSYFMAQKGFNVIVNDLLYSNYVAYRAWLVNDDFSQAKIDELLKYFNSISEAELEDNYFSTTYGGKYFSVNDSKKIGYIRDYIELHKNEFSEREYYILIAALMYAIDKIANTVGHFEYFLKTAPRDTSVQLESLDLTTKINGTIFNTDANTLVKTIKADVVYIDPPYNARQYVNFYHVLENLARWNKPTDFDGNSMKFKRDELKSGYSRSAAPTLFKNLIEDLKCKVIVVSYNNTYSAKSIASINKISEQQIIEILSSKGNVTKKEIKYSAFNAGKTDMNDHKEFLFVCEVNAKE